MPLPGYVLDELMASIIPPGRKWTDWAQTGPDYLREKIQEYFDKHLVLVFGDGSVESAAAEYENLTLADDEIAEILQEAQRDNECAGIVNPLIASLVERCYEDTDAGDRRACPDLWVVRVEETEHWEPWFLAESGIEKAYRVSLVDRNAVTHVCELTGSYTLYFAGYSVQMKEGAELTEGAEQTIGALDSERVTYVHCSDIDKLWKDKELAHQWRPAPLLTNMYTEETDYEDLIEERLDHYRGNPVW